jgi:HAD superfamily hydrolase (TIGR01509 family)
MVGKADHLLYDILKSWKGFPNDWTVLDFIENKNSSLLKILKNIPTEDFFSEQLRALLDQAKNDQITIGLVTSSEKIITHELLKISKTYDYFDLILTRDDSLKVKPDPWPYLYAMTQLNCRSDETLIFEDSNVGMEAAIKSGANVIKANWYEN